MLLVTQVEGPDTAAVRHVARYRCTGFNQSRPEAGELSRINWLVSAAGRTIAEFPARGAVLEFAPMDDLEGCTITVQPYRNRPSAQVGVTTRVTRGARHPGPGGRPATGRPRSWRAPRSWRGFWFWRGFWRCPCPRPALSRCPGPAGRPAPRRQPLLRARQRGTGALRRHRGHLSRPGAA